MHIRLHMRTVQCHRRHYDLSTPATMSKQHSTLSKRHSTLSKQTATMSSEIIVKFRRFDKCCFDVSRTFFKRIIRDNSNVLWYLLPAKRDVQLTSQLRCARQYSTIYARTNRYKNSLIVYGLNHWQ